MRAKERADLDGLGIKWAFVLDSRLDLGKVKWVKHRPKFMSASLVQRSLILVQIVNDRVEWRCWINVTKMRLSCCFIDLLVYISVLIS